ncbi:MAG TPA: ABC transporter substrate-binding protein [Methanotrichaceae archaeon]|nr:ABC transporter substrate-binding protein [Methanotrichaceae archaeon]
MVIVAVFSVSIVGLNMGFSKLLANTYHGDEVVGGMDLPMQEDGSFMNKSLDVKVYKTTAEVPQRVAKENTTEGILDRIKHRSVLRVGYNSNSIPFTFFNKKGSLVGYDVEMAYELAHFIEVKRIEFIPVSYSSMDESLNSGACDIIMAGVPVTPERLDKVTFTTPYLALHLAVVVKDNRKDDFMRLEDIQKMAGLRLAAPVGSEYLNISTELFPNATMLKINNSREFFVGDKADALLTTAEEGSVMTLLNPFYDVAMFEPSDTYKVLCAYSIAKSSDESFQTLLDYWIRMDEEYGTLKERYDYWMLGKGVEKKLPRWCVVRDVLHWED